MPVARKGLLLVFALHLVSWVFAQSDDGYTDENRPYKFGFNIEGYQHRKEEKDEKGIIMGEFGFITADGYYRVTVYATDENGNFRILKMKNIYVGFPPDDPTTRAPLPARASSALPAKNPASPSISSPAPNLSFQQQTPKLAQGDLGDRINTPTQPAPPSPSLTATTQSRKIGCSNCQIPTTTPKPYSLSPDFTPNLKNPPSGLNNVQNSGGIPGTVNLDPYQPPYVETVPLKGNSPPSVGSYPKYDNSLTTPSSGNFVSNPSAGIGPISNNLGSNPKGISGPLGTPHVPGTNPLPGIGTISGNFESNSKGLSGSPPIGSVSTPGVNFGVTGTNPSSGFKSTGGNFGINPTEISGSPPIGSVSNLGVPGTNPSSEIGSKPGNFNFGNNPTGISGSPPIGSVSNLGVPKTNPSSEIGSTPGNFNFGNNPTGISGSPPIGSIQPPGVNLGVSQVTPPNSIQSNSNTGTPFGGINNVPSNPSKINQPLNGNTNPIFPILDERFGDSPGSSPQRKPGDIREGLPPGVSLSEVMGLLYKFNYTVGYHGHNEQGYLDGSKEGQYYFNSRDGRSHRVTYIANEFGYQPNITIEELGLNSPDTPKEETEKEAGLKGYEFIWYNQNNSISNKA